MTQEKRRLFLIRKLLNETETYRGVEIPADEAEQKDMRAPSELLPHCPECGRPMTMNLRADDRFVEDAGWYIAEGYYENFIKEHRNGKVLYLELGVGGNTPVIIKYPFWRLTAENPQAVYACVNLGQSFCPKEIEGQSVCIDGDIGTVLEDLKKQ